MAKVTVSLDAELVVEVVVLAGVGNPQDAVELVVRDYIARGHRTEALVADREGGARHGDQARGTAGLNAPRSCPQSLVWPAASGTHSRGVAEMPE